MSIYIYIYREREREFCLLPHWSCNGDTTRLCFRDRRAREQLRVDAVSTDQQQDVFEAMRDWMKSEAELVKIVVTCDCFQFMLPAGIQGKVKC